MKVLGKLIFVTTLLILISFSSSDAQRSTLDENFREYEIATFDSKALKAYAGKRSNDFIRIPFKLSDTYNWQLELTNDEIFSKNYLQRQGSVSSRSQDLQLPMVLRGYSQQSNNIRATITVNDDFLYGRVDTETDVIFFEPLGTFDPNAKPSEIVIYKLSDVIEKENGTCAAHESKRKIEKLKLSPIGGQSNSRFAGECKQVDLAIANDFNMFTPTRNTNAAITAFNAGVMANVNTDYDHPFGDEVRFVIVETYIAQNAGQNSWGATNDINALLNNFTSWAPSNFTNTHDLGQLWSNTDLLYNGSSSTIGLAWVGTVCGSYRYHVLEEYGGSANGLRNLVSHEIGHNFSLSHVSGSGFIMSGSVGGNTAWNSASVSGVNSYLNSISCLGTCSPGGGGGGTPPVAAFDATLLQECSPTRVRLNDLSTNTPTSWSWQIQNGSPSTSSQQNPEIDLPGGGTYTVTLTATNADGSDTRVLNMNLNNIGNPPNATYTYSVSGFTATFDNNTTGGLTYSWDFGDGSTSAAANPSYTYASPGSYTVVLTSTSDCGTDTHTETVTITDQVTAAFTSNTTEICEGESVSYTNQSSANSTSFAWEFENGTPSTSTQENPTITYNNAGPFNAKLTVSGGGTTDIENKVNYISVNDVPNTAFTETIDGYDVTFDNNTTGGLSYSWAFGDGGSSSSPNPSHTYSTSGTYSVTLTSLNDCGSDDVVRQIVIADEVIAAFEVNQTDGCANESYSFTSTSSGNITTYAWEFEDGIPATSSDENPTISFSSSGNKNIILTVSNSLYNDVENKVNYITIIGEPNANFDFTISENTVTFDNNTTGGFTYNWDFGDGNTSATPNPSHTYDGPGDYQVTLVSNNDCEEGEITKTVSIESEVVASFTASDTEICPSESVDFTNTSEGTITGYAWEFQGGTPSTSTAEHPTVTFDGSGNYDVKLTVTDGSLQDSENKNNYISVLDTPTPTFQYEVNGYVVTFDNNTQNGIFYVWSFGDSESSTSANPSHTYAGPGTYEVVLASSNDCGSEDFSATIVIDEFVAADFEYSTSEICAGETVAFGNISGGNIASYSWEFEGGSPATSSDENPTVTYTVAGSYDVKLTVIGDFGAQDSKTLTEIINVNASPTADFSYVLSVNTVTFTNLSENYSSLSWDFGDGETTIDESPSHTYNNENNYTVLLTVEGSCGSDIKEIEIPVFDELLANFQASETTICPGEEVVLEDLSSGNPTEWVWNIMGEQMISVEEQNPVLNLDQPGTYTVELTVRNADEENSKTIQQYLEVMPLPEVEFTYNQNELLVVFDNNSDNGIGYFWDFGDGTTSTDPNPSHEYLEEGNYVVMLQVENSCSVEEIEQEVGVFNRLVVGFNAGETEICATNSIQFNNQSSGNATSWKWSFPGGSPATSAERSPIVTYENAGSFDVMLTVNSETEELTETKTAFVNVVKLPIAEFEFDVDKNQVQFYNLSENGTSHSWSFGSQELSPTFEFEEEKAYEITLITSNGCSSDTLTQIVDLYEEAGTYANFSISGNSYCLGDEISFIDLSSEDITEWQWKFPGASPAESTEKNPSVLYETFGIYNVELTVTNGFNTRTILLEDYVTIVEKPTAEFTLNQTNNVIEITNTPEHAGETVWFINDKKIEGDLNSYTFTENGNFTIRQLISNSCGDSEATESVEVTVFPSAGFSLDVAQGCAPLTVNFESRSTENADEVIWILEGLKDPEVSGFTPSVIYQEAGNYGIKVIAKNEFGADTIELNSIIEVYKKPEVSFDFDIDGLEVIFLAEAETYDRVLWDFGDGETADEFDVMHEYSEGGTYNVTVEVFIGDCSSTFTQEVTLLSSGIDDLDLGSSVIVFPNPASRFVEIQFEDVEGVQSVDIIDQLGRKLYTKELVTGSKSSRIENLSNIPSGQYFISINVVNEVSVFKKLVIVR